MANRVRINRRGFEEVAKRSSTGRALTTLGERVADNVRAQGIRVGDKDGGSHEAELPVDVSSGVTSSMRMNRAKVWVTITHPSGKAVQAKHGSLTKAAAQAGLEVRDRS